MTYFISYTLISRLECEHDHLDSLQWCACARGKSFGNREPRRSSAAAVCDIGSYNMLRAGDVTVQCISQVFWEVWRLQHVQLQSKWLNFFLPGLQCYRILGNYVELQQRAHEYGCGSMPYVTLLFGRCHQAGAFQEGAPIPKIPEVFWHLWDSVTGMRASEKSLESPWSNNRLLGLFGNQDGEWLQWLHYIALKQCIMLHSAGITWNNMKLHLRISKQRICSQVKMKF